jgi:hypothetical protein
MRKRIDRERVGAARGGKQSHSQNQIIHVQPLELKCRHLSMREINLVTSQVTPDAVVKETPPAAVLLL